MSSKSINERSKRFGNLVRKKREQRGWLQAKLAYEMTSQTNGKITYDTQYLSRLELGKIQKIDIEVVTTLANALHLSADEKDIFYREAGYDPPLSSDASEWLTIVKNYNATLPFPIAIFDTFFNFHSINSELAELFDIPLERLTRDALFKGAGVNVLQFLLDPSWNAKNIYGGGLKEYAILNMFLFQQASRDYVNIETYKQVIEGLKSISGSSELSFDAIWAAAENLKEMPPPPYLLTVQSPNYGVVTYLHIEMVMSPRFDKQMQAVAYFPVDITSKYAFHRVYRKTRQDRKIYVFDQNESKGYKIYRING